MRNAKVADDTTVDTGGETDRGGVSRRLVAVGIAGLAASGLGLGGAALSNAVGRPAAAPAASLAPAPQPALRAAAPAGAVAVAGRQVRTEARADRATAERASAARDAAQARATARAARSASRAPVAKANLTGSPKAIARTLVSSRGWGSAEFRCLESLWEKESNWRATADNPTSSAYGIPQALPGHRMKSHGADWRTNPATQIRWGLDYIADRYTRPCNAWAHSRANNWY